jgi:hypothetical protein
MKFEFNIWPMHLIDEEYHKTPAHNQPWMTAHRRRLGLQVNHKRVQCPPWIIELQAVHLTPHTSAASANRKTYPYLLGAMVIICSNQGMRADITWVGLAKEVIYLAVIYFPVEPVCVVLAAASCAGAGLLLMLL